MEEEKLKEAKRLRKQSKITKLSQRGSFRPHNSIRPGGSISFNRGDQKILKPVIEKAYQNFLENESKKKLSKKLPSISQQRANPQLRYKSTMGTKSRTNMWVKNRGREKRPNLKYKINPSITSSTNSLQYKLKIFLKSIGSGDQNQEALPKTQVLASQIHIKK